MRLIDQRRIQHADFQLPQQVGRIMHLGMHRVVTNVLADQPDPAQHQRVAQADLAADAQHLIEAFGQRQIALRRFPGLHHLIGIHHKRLTIGRQPCTGAVADEQRAIEMAFELLHPCGDGRLGDVQTLGGSDKTAVPSDGQKSAGQVDIHMQPLS